jgi:hypothetical protein
VDVLDPIAQRAMDERWPDGGGPAQTNTLGAKMYQNFAITDDSVIFLIDQGQQPPMQQSPWRFRYPGLKPNRCSRSDCQASAQ